MKRLFLPLAILAITLASCDTNSGESYSSINFSECNLIRDLNDTSKPAQISSGIYAMTANWTYNYVQFNTVNVILNNQTISFSTDTIALKRYYLVSQNGGSSFELGNFSRKDNVGKGATITNLSALYTPANYAITDIYLPGLETSYVSGYRLIMGYDLNDTYHVQTFWPDCFYVGQTNIFASSFNTSQTAYRVTMDTSKNTARIIVYYPEFSSSDQEVPRAIMMEDIPIKFNNKFYYLESEAPTTKVLGTKDNVTAWVESEQYKASNFSLTVTEDDLTEVAISYEIDGKRINFSGASIVKAKK